MIELVVHAGLGVAFVGVDVIALSPMFLSHLVSNTSDFSVASAERREGHYDPLGYIASDLLYHRHVADWVSAGLSRLCSGACLSDKRRP